MRPPDFYGMSFGEWFAALEGLRASLGLSEPAMRPATSADFPELDRYMGPSRSIKAA